MNIFVTGGSGYVGRAVVAALAGAGHDVTALARSETSGERLSRVGASPLAGDLLDPRSYAGAAGTADVVIHLAFDYAAAADGDSLALDTLLAATGGRSSILVYTSGCWVLGDTGGELRGEDAPTDHPADIVAWRVEPEARVRAAADAERVTAVVRPGVVYGDGGGLTARMFATAVKGGAADFVGTGENHWSLIHVDDLAQLYLAVVESRRSGTYNGVDGHPMTVLRVAEAASEAAGAGGETRAAPLEAAREKVGALADAMCLDQTLSAPASRALGWVPGRRSFAAAAVDAYREWQTAQS